MRHPSLVPIASFASAVFLACAPSALPPPPPTATATSAVVEAPASPSSPAPAIGSAEAPSCRKLPPVLPTPEQPRGPMQPDGGVRTPGLSPGLPDDAPRALVSACGRLENLNRRAEKTIPGRARDVKQGAETLRSGKCFSAKRTKGAWIVDVGPHGPQRQGTLSFHRATWTLRYLMPDGKGTAGPARGNIDTIEGEWGRTIDVLGVHDFDGDGVAEVLIANVGYSALDGFERAVTAWTFRDGSVVPFRPELPQQGWLDVDADGRPDVLLPSLEGTRAYAVLHTLPDGGTSADDDVVRASLARICPAPPRGPLRTEREVACALRWGATTESVAARIDDAKSGDTCRPALLQLLRAPVAPPLLVGACPSEIQAPAEPPQGMLRMSPCP